MRRSPEELARRRALLPKPEFPAELPVCMRRDDIARAINDHQVVIVCGETGSGKTTQLPKICLSLGRGVLGLIGHTQPRRIAARATAARIAQELDTELGKAVGFKIRFNDRMSRDSYVKLMTDGILLAETQTDPELRQYDTIIIDEAHERSLNIDFLLGYVQQLLPRRPDLKLIITSATIDADRFARQFGDAPIIEVSGRLFPVEIRYRPLVDDEEEDGDINDAIVTAVDELARQGPGDVLVFLPGEREIREATEALRKHHPNGTELLPLYARLSVADQERVFRPYSGRRVVLATNVAETSLTVPGIRYVVDTGYARIKRYSFRNKVEQLQVERISQAAAKQRAGRCGRVASGICIRLYAEDDHAKRAEYTDPEILRSSLAGVILRMLSLGLGDVEDFPFIDPPSSRAIADGYALLQELGAIDIEGDGTRRLTHIGRQVAKLPVDPRVGRIILAAHKEGSLNEVIVIAAALSVQDPRDRPMERAQAADEAQKRFDDERSDFISFLKLWKFFIDGLEEESSRKLNRHCRDLFLSYNRLREWRDTVFQLRELVGEMHWKVEEPSLDPARHAAIHRALLTGLLGNVGLKGEDAGYQGARGIKFFVHPGSSLAKKGARWIMAAELTETTRLFARTVAGIDPRWIEQVGAHLMKKTQSEPHWEKKAGQVVAMERGTLYGIPLYVNRRVPFGPINPREARNIFIRQALVDGGYDSRAPFFVRNQKLLAEIQQLEHKSRRPDVLVDDELIHAFYDSRIPEGVWSDTKLTAWRSDAERENRRLLFLEREDLMRHEAAGITTAQFPSELEMAGHVFALDYLHDPGGPRDGVTLTIPLVALNQVNASQCEWLVPGLIREKVAQLMRSLPQKLRHRLGAPSDFAERFVVAEAAGSGPLPDVIIRFARTELNVTIPIDAFRMETIGAHLFMNFLVVDEHGRQLAIGRNLAQIRSEHGGRAEERFTELAKPRSGMTGITSWSFGDLEEIMEIRRGAETLMGYPALIDDGESVSLQVHDAPGRAVRAHRAGLRRLFLLHMKDQTKYIERTFASQQTLTLQLSVIGDANALRRDLVAATFERACMGEPWPRTEADFLRRAEEGRARLGLISNEIARLLGNVLAAVQVMRKKLPGIKSHPTVVKDIEEQLSRLLAPGFIIDTPFERLSHYPRYLNGASIRLEKLRTDPTRDQRLMAELIPIEREWQREDVKARRADERDPQLDQFRWLLEELRVSLFAQELKTPMPVSARRLARMWQTIQR
ncbi:MAG: ATP-dependent RNA helicase HrpA [Betaproteobacteria bacterium]|nr:ATP-dependent RNA helicase HrpA [Betaproteobacteria bacterium]